MPLFFFCANRRQLDKLSLTMNGAVDSNKSSGGGSSESGSSCERNPSSDGGWGSLDRESLERKLSLLGNKLSIDKKHPAERAELLDGANEYLLHVSKLTSDGKTFEGACWEAFYYIGDKEQYPFGTSGRVGVHDDMLTYLLTPRIGWTRVPHDAMCAHQFMARHTQEVGRMAKRRRVKDGWTRQYQEHILESIGLLPVRSREYLQTWINGYVNNLPDRFQETRNIHHQSVTKELASHLG